MPQPLPEGPTHIDEIVPGHGGVRRVQGQVGDALERLEVLVRVEREGAAGHAHREHVLHGDRDPGAPLDVRELVHEPPPVRGLPSVRRMDDDHGDAGGGRHLDRTVDLPDRIGPPHLPRQQEAGGVQRADLETELLGERPDPGGDPGSRRPS